MDNNPNNENVSPDNSQPAIQQPITPDVVTVVQAEPVVPEIATVIDSGPTLPQASLVQPTIEPVPPTPPVIEPVVTAAPQPVTKPAATVVPQPVVAAKPIETKKENSKLLWTSRVAVVIVLIGLVIGSFLISNSASEVASVYVSSVKTYLGKVNNSLTAVSSTIINIKDSVSKLAKPTLETVQFGSLSAQYTKAQKLGTDTNKKMDDLNTQLAGYAAVYDYETTGNQILLELNTLAQPVAGAEAKYFTTMLDIMNRMKTLIDKNKSQAPSELKPTFTEMSAQYMSMINSLTDIIAAINNKDTAALKLAQTDFATAYNANTTTTSKKAIGIYYDKLSIKLKASADSLKSYTADIK